MEKKELKALELNDDQLDVITGGYQVGATVHCRSDRIEYCSNCARLLTRYDATITGVRGVLDGTTIYWITRHCCGYKTSVSEWAIID